MTAKHRLAELHGRKVARAAELKKAKKEFPAGLRERRNEDHRDAGHDARHLGQAKDSVFLHGLTAVMAVFLWSYWPTLVTMVQTWESVPDYSHGYLVAPVALYFAWHRRQQLPRFDVGFYWPGVAMIGLAVAVRYVGALFYYDSIDGWSIPLFVAGAVWLLCGASMVWFCLPSIGFLFFMIPLPFKAETMLSLPLQKVSTKVSCFVLQCLGQPVIAEGNTILLDQSTFEIAEACSGLRIFVGIAALAFAYLVLIQRPWWQKVFIALCVGPIAIVANSTRVVLTVLLHEWASAALSHSFSHDLAGWIMIPYAALLFGMLIVYLGWLFPASQQLELGNLLRTQGRAEAV